MRIKCERVEAKYLKRGELFTEYSPEHILDTNKAVVEIYLCLNPIPDDETTFFRLTIHDDPEPILSVPALKPELSLQDAPAEQALDATEVLWAALTL